MSAPSLLAKAAPRVAAARSRPTPWSRTAHYHRILLSALPRARRRALEVGCGEGDFARTLAGHFARVDAVDRLPQVIARARDLSVGVANVHFVEADFTTAPVEEGAYDFVCALASLHHLPFTFAIEKMKTALQSGGALGVIGLWRGQTVADYVLSGFALPISHVYRMTHASSAAPPAMPMAVRDPDMTLHEIRQTVARILPGARLKRHLLWRYTLIWRKP